MLTSIQAEEDETAGMHGEEAMERYLGPSTLAKIRAEMQVDDEEAESDYEDKEEVEEEGVEDEEEYEMRPSPIAAAIAAAEVGEEDEIATE
jgi:hypothetical protein